MSSPADFSVYSDEAMSTSSKAREKESQILRQRLQDAMVSKKITPRALSLAIGANHSYVSQIISGKGGTPSALRLASMAEVLETTVEYLSGAASAPEQVRSEVSLSDKVLDWNGPPRGEPGIPLVGTGDCADLVVTETSTNREILIERASFDPEFHTRYIARPPALAGARDIYAIYFHGDSMEPRYEAGEIGLVDPRRPVRPGDYVLVQLTNGEDADVVTVLVKRLVRQTAAEVELEQFNPPLTFALPKSKVARMHRIMQQTDLLFG